MRILAIRGCNLASLAGEFEIDLAHGPLGVAGVFAIVGPTGAGKSTLLDAMCVALFDRTPRLPGHSRVTVGHGEEDPLALGAQDPRTLLRRGASQGWAEVDFESGDQRRYRARWSVRRARGETHGNLQDQQISLVGLDAESIITERLGGTKTETLKAIHQRLGLTFDQFRRSALLAQGDFAAFLRAEGKDRSELLERMTGTEIYSKLSIAAHTRAVAAEQMLKDRHGAALAIAVLADPERARLEADLVIAFAERDAARVRLAAAEKLAAWRIEAGRRESAVARSAAELALAETVAGEAGPLRDQLVLVRRAEALRPTWDAATRLERQQAIAQGELAAAHDTAVTAVESQRELATTHARIVELHGPIRSARIAAGIVELEIPGTGGRRLARGTVAPELEAPGASELFGLSERVERAEQRGHGALAAATWLVERRAMSGEVAAWPELAAKLAQNRTLADGIATADRVLGDQAIERASLAQKHLAAGIAFETAKQKLAQATRETETYVKRRTITPEAAARAEDDARARCGELDRLVATAAGARDATKVLREHDLRLAELELAAVIDRDRGELVTREREAAAVLRGERERVVRELRKAAGYEHARAELVDGEPCPLCGADEHPWKDRGAFDALIADAERVHGEAETAWNTATAALAQLAARTAQRDGDRARFTSTRVTALAAAAAHAEGWRAQLGALGELSLVTDPATPDAEHLATERADAARARLEAARAARSATLAVEKAIGEAQAHREVCLADVGHHDAALRAIDGDLSMIDAAVERITVERDAKRERHAELGRELATVVARWHAALPAPDHDAFAAKRTTIPDHAAFERIVDAWRERSAIVAQAEAALATVRSELDRATLAVERAVADTGARQAETDKRVRDLAAELAAATAALADARVTAGFERADLQRLLAEEPGRAETIATELEALDRAVDRARTRIAERRRLVADHEAIRPPAGGRDAELDADRVGELAAIVTTASDHAAKLQATLAADADARHRRDEALSQFAAAERAAEVDRVLGQVIGSHDGKLFRSFAQSLTLDQLLAVANAHLEELAPRYQLERVPKHDLELQVIDRDFGGEVRSVQSLSGGESFLVSLALALGLSSMSAHDVRVRTLLIDEGFGTLDPATLDSALAVLDELQATGRQVGVISHVPALLDRVRAHVRVTPRGGGRSDVFVPPS